MHFITKGLPAVIAADGAEYPVRCDFRRWILITKLLGEEKLPAERKLRTAARIAGLPDSMEITDEAARGILEFAACGPVSDGQDGDGEVLFDFDGDGDAIFAGFLQTYGVDLTETPMHWWKFIALLKNLPPETEFMNRVQLRSMDLRQIEDDALRKKLRRAKAKVRIRQNQGKEE